MSIEAINAAIPVQLSPAQKAILMCLANAANEAGECWPSIDGQISKFTCLGRTAIIDGLKALIASSLVTATKKEGCPTTYRLDFAEFARRSSTSVDQSAKRTRPASEPVRAPDGTRPSNGLDPSGKRTPPVRQADPNHQLTIMEPEGEPSTVVDRRPPNVDWVRIVASYQRHLPMLPKVQVMTKKSKAARTKLMRDFWCFLFDVDCPARFRATDADQGYRAVDRYFETAAKNDFLCGRVPGRDGKPPFRPDLFWLISDKGRVHVIERTPDAGASNGSSLAQQIKERLARSAGGTDIFGSMGTTTVIDLPADAVRAVDEGPRP